MPSGFGLKLEYPRRSISHFTTNLDFTIIVASFLVYTSVPVIMYEAIINENTSLAINPSSPLSTIGLTFLSNLTPPRTCNGHSMMSPLHYTYNV